MEEPKKTFYVLKDVDKFKAGQVVQLTRSEASDYLNGGFVAFWHIAVKNGLVGKTSSVSAPVKVAETSKKDSFRSKRKK